MFFFGHRNLGFVRRLRQFDPPDAVEVGHAFRRK
jgi:hypothetical protein